MDMFTWKNCSIRPTLFSKRENPYSRNSRMTSSARVARSKKVSLPRILSAFSSSRSERCGPVNAAVLKLIRTRYFVSCGECGVDQWTFSHQSVVYDEHRWNLVWATGLFGGCLGGAMGEVSVTLVKNYLFMLLH